jgi:hypothetical protein
MSVPTVFTWQSEEERLEIRSGFARTRSVPQITGVVTRSYGIEVTPLNEQLRVSVLLGHQSIRVTERHYAPWTRSRQEQIEAD